MNKYIGHPSQISGVEELIVAKGKGKGMSLLEIRNGKGLHITLSPDRCMDISRISFKGDNMGFFAPSGYVAPAYYDDRNMAFLKSFTAGFLTTCGLGSAGKPCVDQFGEAPMHGTVSNIPCDNYCYTEDEEKITVRAHIRDAYLFAVKLSFDRSFVIYKDTNKVEITDVIENIGTAQAPCMLLYHFNMGYPLLSENARVVIPHNKAVARDEHALSGFDSKLVMEKPQSGYQEMCYYYDLKEKDGIASAGIYNPDIKKGVVISFDKTTLDKFIQWKMMGETDYVLGLEPANCYTDGRDEAYKNNQLKILNAGEKYTTKIFLDFTEDEDFVASL